MGARSHQVAVAGGLVFGDRATGRQRELVGAPGWGEGTARRNLQRTLQFPLATSTSRLNSAPSAAPTSRFTDSFDLQPSQEVRCRCLRRPDSAGGRWMCRQHCEH